MTAHVFDDRVCLLGEGPLWHPLRKELFWFDIVGKKLHASTGVNTRSWSFDTHHSAAGWVDQSTLIIASETGLWRFDIETGNRTKLVDLEADQPGTRSNDGRADPWGGFWIGTMGKNAEPELGAIYRYYQGKLRQLFDRITISNAICFAPDRSCAYFADTDQQKIWRVKLDPEGWPAGQPDVFLDLGPDELWPDGAVTDAEGALWNAQWGAGRVARYLPDGRFDRALSLPAPNTTCPVFAAGRLLATTAQGGMEDELLAAHPQSGLTFDLGPVPFARDEPAVKL
ncbi:gluconolactonase [Gemmobacter lanyuensis]|uniref:Gluconolactonase n=1 Tax=Gemmobacter lanyuensis TaxID=1054497 RepID=A0A918IYY9_9RHOB|nr:SMP-30/gluconolactonase/LRE family protein [Gemmobacter lanyuensis]GGW35193.1 gluconolactonase [Gemmobacter lanyuensis]